MAGPTTMKDPTLYFGYGSNLWKAQMLQRCPESMYLGIARLDGYRWIISERGYANVVEVSSAGLQMQNGTAGSAGSDDAGRGGEEEVVWGLVYSLSSSDEAKLDRNEGVPVAYTKENLLVNFWPINSSTGKPDTSSPPEELKMLVYIDRLRTEPDEPKREYVYRMNMGIADAVDEGMPEGYVRDVVRKFIPESDEGEEGEEVRVLAGKQAREFGEE